MGEGNLVKKKKKQQLSMKESETKTVCQINREREGHRGGRGNQRPTKGPWIPSGARASAGRTIERET